MIIPGTVPSGGDLESLREDGDQSIKCHFEERRQKVTLLAVRREGRCSYIEMKVITKEKREWLL